jgi:hypothetical protein
MNSVGSMLLLLLLLLLLLVSKLLLHVSCEATAATWTGSVTIRSLLVEV